MASMDENWHRGTRGFIPKTTQAQRMELMMFWAGNRWNTTKGREYLWENFEIELSEKALYNLKKKLHDSWESRNKNLDEEVDWNNLVALQELCDIPPQATALRTTLYDIWDTVQWRLLTKPSPVTDPTKPSYRAIKWWGHMEYHKAKIDNFIDRLVIASQYTVRDLLADCEKTDIDRDDIDKWLILEPWSSKEKMEVYLRLVKEKTIQPLDELLVRELVNETVDRRLDINDEDPWIDTLYFQGDMFLGIGKRMDERIAPHGTLVDELFDYEGAWRFLLPSQRSHKETIENWVKEIEGGSNV